MQIYMLVSIFLNGEFEFEEGQVSCLGAAAMAVEEGARCNFGLMKFESSINERAVKNWVSRVEMKLTQLWKHTIQLFLCWIRSEARDVYIRLSIDVK